MGLYCVLCGNRAKIVSYHKFPKDDGLLEQWLSFCQIPKSVLSSATRLCSDHFKEDDFIHRLNCVMLKPGVIPSVFSKKKSKRRKLKNQKQTANEQMVQIIPTNIQNLPATFVSSPSPESSIAENEFKNDFQVSDIQSKGQMALTSTEKSKLWYQRKKRAKKNSSPLHKLDVANFAVKLENEIDIDISESQFHSELQDELPVREQQSDIFSNLCRSCAKQNEHLIPINAITSDGTSVTAIFNEIGLSIPENDEFPKKICQTCLDEILLVHKFYKKIEHSKSVFERLLLDKRKSEPVDVKKENNTFYENEDDGDEDYDNLELKQIDENDPLYECCYQKMCSICGMKRLQDDDQLLEHQLSQHAPVSNQEDCNIMTCPYCKIEFSIRSWYDEHLKECLGQLEPNQCTVCELFVRPNDFDDHLRRRHALEKIDSDSFRCVASENCAYVSGSVLILNEHQMAEHDKSLYVCADCGSDFIAGRKLIDHRRTHVKETHWCRKCDTVFADSKKRQRHNIVYHSTSKNHCCDECDMKFSTQNYLRQHKIIHNDVKPFNCSECGASFNQQSSLVYHMKQHTGEDLLVCSVCSTKFDKASKLTSHMEIHTKAGENPHRCDVCRRTFTHAATLKVHSRVHKTDGEAASDKNST